MRSDLIKQPSKIKTVTINNNFMIKTHLGRISSYNVYQGVDIEGRQHVTIYVKLHKVGDTKNGFCKRKMELYTKLASSTPKFIWSGDVRISNVPYQVEIFQKLGPSLQEVFMISKHKLVGHTPHILTYNILLLLEKLHDNGYVYRHLNPAKLFLPKSSQHNDIYFAQFIECYKKGEACPSVGSKYSSIGVHLGLPASFKDDLESLCYIMFDMFTQGSYLKINEGIPEQKQVAQYLSIKNDFDIQKLKGVPQEYTDFYIYVRNLSQNQQPALQHWKKQLRKYFLPEQLKLPYNWVPRSRTFEQYLLNLVQVYQQENQQQLAQQNFGSSRQFKEDDQTVEDKLSRIGAITLNTMNF